MNLHSAYKRRRKDEELKNKTLLTSKKIKQKITVVYDGIQVKDTKKGYNVKIILVFIFIYYYFVVLFIIIYYIWCITLL